MTKEKERIAEDIEAVFERLHGSAYSKGHFYEDEFFIRSEYALVVLNKENEIMVSFADHTRPSYSALYALLLDDIDDADLFICEDYRTDKDGSMIIDEVDGQSTGGVIWDEKERYYEMLRGKVRKIIIRKSNQDGE
jgi:hypothetical protein